MNFIRNIRRKRIEKIIERINSKELFKRYTNLAIGCFIVAFAFNIFFDKYNIVCFGVSGLSLVFKEFGIPTYTFILIANIFLLVLSYFTLGWPKTRNAIVGSLIFPIFVWITSYIAPYINLDNVELLVIAIFGGVLSGIGYGFIFKTNFNTGGTDIITEIISKYTKISLGKATWFSDGIVVLTAKLVFSWETILYGFLVLYIISFMTDKVVLGISQSKAFYIVTNKEALVKEYLLSIEECGVTLIDAKGGYTNEKKELLLCVVPTRQYFLVKEGLLDIDENVFFLVCDAYEVSNNGKRK